MSTVCKRTPNNQQLEKLLKLKKKTVEAVDSYEICSSCQHLVKAVRAFNSWSKLLNLSIVYNMSMLFTAGKRHQGCWQLIKALKAVDNWKKLSKLSTHGQGGVDQLAIEVLDIVVTEEEMVDKVKGVVINY